MKKEFNQNANSQIVMVLTEIQLMEIASKKNPYRNAGATNHNRS